jgi:hypothetical protein
LQISSKTGVFPQPARLALGAGAVAAGVKYQFLMRTVVTLFDACAQGGGSACADVTECLALLGREAVTPARKEILFVLAKDIGDFQPMFSHRCRPLSRE